MRICLSLELACEPHCGFVLLTDLSAQEEACRGVSAQLQLASALLSLPFSTSALPETPREQEYVPRPSLPRASSVCQRVQMSSMEGLRQRGDHGNGQVRIAEEICRKAARTWHLLG